MKLASYYGSHDGSITQHEKVNLLLPLKSRRSICIYLQLTHAIGRVLIDTHR